MQSLPRAIGCVLLLGIQPADQLIMVPILSNMGLDIQRMEPRDLLRVSGHFQYALIVTDANSHGVEVIRQVQQVLTQQPPSTFDSLPPILVLVEISNAGQCIFEQGAKDCISSPLIAAEFSLRVSLALPHITSVTTQHHSLCFLPAQQRNTALVDRMINYLNAHIAEEISLSRLAREMGSNRSTISVEFKRRHNMTIFQWLRERRMERAQQLLQTTSYPITAIAECVGYHDSNNFATAFKRFFGISPLEYRKNQSYPGLHIEQSGLRDGVSGV